MHPLRSIAQRLALALACAGGLSACSTPSVPLPPPYVDTSALRFAADSAAGSVVLRGAASQEHAGVRFFVIDHATGDGVLTTAAADGSFMTPPLKATVGDVAEVYFEKVDGERSESVCVTVLIESPLIGASCP